MWVCEMSMSELSLTPTERARKAYSEFLNAMKPVGTAQKIAELMGTSETTISNIKNQKVEDALYLLYQLGYKLVPADKVCVSRDMYASVTTIARRAFANEETANSLMWDDE